MHRLVPSVSRWMFLASSFLFAASLLASPPQDAQTAPDNTEANKTQAAKGAVTADQQPSNTSDLQATKNIRSAIMKDKSLSTYAHNVKIITKDGKVTLKGPVRSDDEKSNVEAKAAAVVGPGNVDDEITVAPSK